METSRRNTLSLVRRDWFLYLLLVGVAVCLPSVINTIGWVPDARRLVYVGLWAALIGVLLARSPLPGWLSWSTGVLVGVEYSLQSTARLLPTLGLFLSDVQRFLATLWHLLVNLPLYGGGLLLRWFSPANPAAEELLARPLLAELPFARTIDWSVGQLVHMSNNLYVWYWTLRGGSASQDNTALWLGVSFVIWMLTWYAAYGLLRQRRTFGALVPLGVAVVLNVAYTGVGMSYVYYYLALTLLVQIWANIGRLESVWASIGVDFSADLRRDVLVAGVGVSAIIFVAAMYFPYITFNDAAWFFWDNFGSKIKPLYERWDQAFAGRNPAPTAEPNLVAAFQGHQLSTGGQLSEDVVMLVRTSDPAPPTQEEIMVNPVLRLDLTLPKHYWRQITYDVYTGHGWDSSERDASTEVAGDKWDMVSYPSTVLIQTYALVNHSFDLAFGVNEPVSVDSDYQVLTRGPGDLMALSVLTDTYTVVSEISSATADELEQAEEPYPDWVTERYTQLPEVPARVRELAQQVVDDAGAVTRYDKARAIEAFLRTYPYDLNIEPPPLDADVVDYYLFDIQRGYCDYSATAMVVMLRSVGVAARYASGYAMGDFDHGRKAYVVREADAHAWAEVYFPGYGWIEFEPTPSQVVFTRGEASGDTEIEPRELPQQATQRQSIPMLWWLGGALLFVLLFAIIWPPRWIKLRQRSPQRRVWQAYARLVRLARWAGVMPDGGQTPAEYLRAFAQRSEQRAAFARGVSQEIDIISQAYQRARYSQHSISAAEGYRAEAAWRRSRFKLFRLLFV